ncbi:DUF6168 family protein [Tenacibaculum ovolyticum]|uniref:DUF6168 family protein n=1 Tax=Tenacibaculum ovolyticum TaxID=104270 RepID=UPI003BACF4F6
MIKRILYFITAVVLLFAVSYTSHSYFLSARNVALPFSLFFVYLFHVIATGIVYVILELIASKLPNEAGYGYLALMLLKIGFFVLIFQDSVFAGAELAKSQRVSLVIPLFIFLITEAIAVSKLLNSK